MGLKFLEFGFWIFLLGVWVVEGCGFGFNFGVLVNGCLKWRVLGIFVGLLSRIWRVCGLSVVALFFQSSLGVNPYMGLLFSSICAVSFLRKAGKRNILQFCPSFVTKRKQNRTKQKRKTVSQLSVFGDWGEFLGFVE